MGSESRRFPPPKEKARGSFLLRALWYHEASAYFINIIFLLFTNFCPDAPVAVMR